jgi:hypothetical protein
MPPGLRTAAVFGVDVASCELADVEAADVVETEEVVVDDTTDGVNPAEEVAVTEPLLITPLGPKFTYAAQSGVPESGQVSSWHKLYSCVPTAGEQRTLYFALSCILTWLASDSENPQCSADRVS